MTEISQQVLALAQLSLNDSRAAVRALLRLGVPLPARTLGLVLIAVLSALLWHLGFLILPGEVDPMTAYMSASPLRSAALQWLILSVTVLLVFRIGKAFGGTGSLSDTLLVLVWLQVIMLAVQLVQLVALIVLPSLVGLLSLAGLGLFVWLLTGFVAELHGFRSRWLVFAGIIGSTFAVALVLAILISPFLPPEMLQGV
jgi:hypothetical protein